MAFLICNFAKDNMSTFPASTSLGRELEWNDLEVILAICRSGSLSGASRALGCNHSTVFRKINAIEEKTGVRFFERLPEGYAMTDAGRTALQYAERVENEMHALGREILGQDLRLQGKIRVTSPEGIAMQIAPALFAKFLELHPEVSIEMLGGTAAVDLARREADIAIRATPKPPDTSLGRKVCDFRFGFYATPDYARRNQDLPLADQRWCVISGTVDWLVPLIWEKASEGEARVIFSSPHSFSVINAAAAGIGITFLPCYLGDTDERLVRISHPVESKTIELWLLTHPDLRHTARVKALMAFLYDELMKDRDLFEGKRINQIPPAY